MRLRLIIPSDNLGCWGLRIGPFYTDINMKQFSSRRLILFLSWEGWFKVWVDISSLKVMRKEVAP